MKSLLRKQFMEKRAALSEKEVIAKSEIIISKLEELPEFKPAKNILCYVSFSTEVETIPFIKKYLLTKSKNILVPKMIGNKLRLFRINSFSDLAPGNFNILEPVNGKEFDAAQLTWEDIILVPGLAFDIAHDRLGYGKGYFDRLLKDTKARKIAIAFELQILTKLPTENHDVKVDRIITEKRII